MRQSVSRIAVVMVLALSVALVPQISNGATGSNVISVNVNTGAPSYKLGQDIVFKVAATSFKSGGYTCPSVPSMYVYGSGSYCYANAKHTGSKVAALRSQVVPLDGMNTKSVTLTLDNPLAMTRNVSFLYTSDGYWSGVLNTGNFMPFYHTYGVIAYKIAVVASDGSVGVTSSTMQAPVSLVK